VSATSRDGVVAVMQPYLYPYAGYFRLLAAAETFVVFDDAQFPRRGRVHRCQVPRAGGGSAWLTLPLARHARDVAIRDLAFAAEARAALDARLRRLPWLRGGRGPLAERVRAHLFGPLATPVDFVETGLALVADSLALPARFVRSSALAIDPALRGPERVIALVEAAGGRTYVNAPNGRPLYDSRAFAAREIALRFLPPYAGAYRFLLPALVDADPAALRRDVLATTRLTE
jgi:WbqC-like protein family